MKIGSRKTQDLYGTNFHVGELSPSCNSCLDGRMLVVGVTEDCPRECYYCPNPKKRSDVSYVGDLILEQEQDLVRGATLIDATAACITGGEPLVRVDRAISFIRTLKHEFGSGFHIHLYSSMTDVSSEVLTKLHESGLDEIRFHLRGPEEKAGLIRAIEFPWRVGIEIPCIPSGPLGKVPEILETARELGVAFVNLNEFQMAPSNYDTLRELGYQPVEPLPETIDDEPVSPALREAMLGDLRYLSKVRVAGSKELAFDLLKQAEHWGVDAPRLHFCSSDSKFSVQKKNRDKRRAANIARPCDEITETGYLLFGRIICPNEDAACSVYDELVKTFEVDESRMRKAGRLVELPWFTAARLKNRIRASRPRPPRDGS